MNIPDNSPQFIECTTLFAKKIMVPREKLEFRVAGYGVVVHNGKLLLTTGKNTGKYWFPGGKAELGEKLNEAIIREVLEETGIEVEVIRFLTFKEVFFYYEPLDQAYHQFSTFFLCKPLSLEVGAEDQLDKEEENEKPRWVEINGLKIEDFQPGAEEAIMMLKDLK